MNQFLAPLPENTVAILLAAGSGSRFTGAEHKLLARLRSRPERRVIDAAVDNVVTAGFRHVILVTGALSLSEVVSASDELEVVNNPRWTEGQATSLQVGLGAARSLSAEVVVIGLADQPFIDPRAWRAVALTGSPIAVAAYTSDDGSTVRGHPVRISREMWQYLPETGDLGARDVIAAHPDKVSQVDCPGSSTDIDTMEDLEQWT